MERFASGVSFEDVVGYSRAVRAGPLLVVSGTTATGPDGEIVGPADPYVQAVRAIENIAAALERAGATLADVIRTRMFVTDIERWRDVARAHNDAFGDVRPATSMVEVSALIDPRMVVEIEALAWVDEAQLGAGAPSG